MVVVLSDLKVSTSKRISSYWTALLSNPKIQKMHQDLYRGAVHLILPTLIHIAIRLSNHPLIKLLLQITYIPPYPPLLRKRRDRPI